MEVVMKIKTPLLIRLIIILSAIFAGIITYSINKTNNSRAEQAVEAVLRSQGIDIDFSPECDTDEY